MVQLSRIFKKTVHSPGPYPGSCARPCLTDLFRYSGSVLRSPFYLLGQMYTNVRMIKILGSGDVDQAFYLYHLERQSITGPSCFQRPAGTWRALSEVSCHYNDGWTYKTTICLPESLYLLGLKVRNHLEGLPTYKKLFCHESSFTSQLRACWKDRFTTSQVQ